ncbi:bifunctional Co-chaperone protein p23-like/HSP20-like chaperone/CS domain [Babesia duncani]|uniref:Bifunctional Co-chaperone protein p23-like/HSP20-like chaperone/CS domain n=1 Tax=Babesia duncani TaxID=323732 RepID=A0AAD9UQJ1_9APIC|nr:bifunctional Co-chaperone protein p23-like/HSP20-like chaperone/CS domain [Babesia duncani]
MLSSELSPNVLWAQNKDALFLTIEISAPEKLDVKFTDSSMYLKALKGDKEYLVEFDFLHPIKSNEVASSKERFLRYKIPKVTSESWSILNSGPKKHYIKCDWDRWVDSDAENDDLDAGFDMSGFGGDFGDMGDYDDFDDSDENHEENDDGHEHVGGCCGTKSPDVSTKVDGGKCSNPKCKCGDNCPCGDDCKCPVDEDGACGGAECCSPISA